MKNVSTDAREQAVRKADELMVILNSIKGTHDEAAVLQTLVTRVFEGGHDRTLRDAISSHFLTRANALYHQKHPGNQNEAISLFKLSSRVKAAW